MYLIRQISTSIFKWVISLFREGLKVDLSDKDDGLQLPVNINLKFIHRVYQKKEDIGTIKIFSGKYIPAGWKACDGETILIREYCDLYKIIGDTYGGDGKTTFCLPDLRGRVPVGAGKGRDLTERSLGQTFGSEYVVIEPRHLPISASSRVRPIGQMSNYTVSETSPSPINNLQPSIAVNYIIYCGKKRNT